MSHPLSVGSQPSTFPKRSQLELCRIGRIAIYSTVVPPGTKLTLHARVYASPILWRSESKHFEAEQHVPNKTEPV